VLDILLQGLLEVSSCLGGHADNDVLLSLCCFLSSCSCYGKAKVKGPLEECVDFSNVERGIARQLSIATRADTLDLEKNIAMTKLD